MAAHVLGIAADNCVGALGTGTYSKHVD